MRDGLVAASVIILLILQGWLYVYLIQGIRRNNDAPDQRSENRKGFLGDNRCSES
jgi:hypothetical protein